MLMVNENMTNYKTSIEINSPAEILFEAISKNLGDWWGKAGIQLSKKEEQFLKYLGEILGINLK